jgi:hypothetical protein
MASLIFTYAPAQRRRSFLRCLPLFVFAAAANPLLTHRLTVRELLLVPVLAVLEVGVLYGYQTRLTDRGIQQRMYFVPGRLRPWSSVESLRTHLTNHNEYVICRLTSGKEFRLRMPLDSERNRDLTYEARVEQLLAFWRQYAPAPPADTTDGAVASVPGGGDVPAADSGSAPATT